MADSVIMQAIDKYRACAKDDRMSGETGRLGSLAGDMDDAIADLLEYINNNVREDDEFEIDHIELISRARAVAEAYARQDADNEN